MEKPAVVGQKVFVEPDGVNVEVDADVREPVTVSVGEFRGRINLNIRHWYQREDGRFARTPKGVIIPFDERVAFLAAAVDAVNLAAKDGTQVRLVVVQADGTAQELM